MKRPAKLHRINQHLRKGFTLVELLVVVVIVATLASLTFTVVRSSMAKARAVQCMAKLRTLGVAVQLYTQDNQGQLPRSFHSAGAHREPGWAVSIAPYLGISESQINDQWPEVFNEFYRSPVDKTTDPYTYSYAMNVHFEMDPDGDDYEGSPTTWHRLSNVPKPEATILLGQTRPVRFGDHLMCHQWSSVQAAKNALNHDVHNGKANYLFLDGHVKTLRVEETFDPSKKRNLWNPGLAR